MTEASRGRVTITLGRSGQVVERRDSAAGANFQSSFPKPGSKRSVRDRLGSNADRMQHQGNESYNKRQREDPDVRPRFVDDVPISKNDLRFKLLQKTESRQGEIVDHKIVDLRTKLSRTARQPFPRHVDNHLHLPQLRDTSLIDRIPSRRIEDNRSLMNLSSNSYSPWSIDRIRRRSPGEIVSTSRGLSPIKSVDRFQEHPSSNRGFDNIGMPRYPMKNVFDATRSLNTSPFTTLSSIPPPTSQPLLPAQPPPGSYSMLTGQLHHLGSTGQKVPCIVSEQQTVEELLKSLGLGKYVILFKAEEVDMPALKQMGENDLKELGIPMGPRKKIIQALMPRPKRQP